MLNSAFQGRVLTWFYRCRTWSPANSARTNRVTSRSSVDFSSGASGKKFSSYLVAARKVTLCVIVDTRPLACNMTSLSPELIYLNPYVFLMSFALPRPSVSLLHLVVFYYAKLKVSIAKTRYSVCCSKLCFLNMVRFYKSEFRTRDYITQRKRSEIKRGTVTAIVVPVYLS